MAADTSPPRPGLLEQITATPLDEDYAHVSRRRAAQPAGESGPRRAGLSGLVVLAAFGGLLAVAGVQTAREASSSASSKQYLVTRVNDGKAALAAKRARITALQKQVVLDQKGVLQATGAGRALQSRITGVAVASAAVPVTGPGIRVVVDDAPDATSDRATVHDTDLQQLVNGLWESGAEAVAINGQRLSSLSAIRFAGQAITVNFRSLQPPYDVTAIGDGNTMGSRLLGTAGGRLWLGLHAVIGLPFETNTEESLTLPAAPRLTLRHAHPPRSAG